MCNIPKTKCKRECEENSLGWMITSSKSLNNDWGAKLSTHPKVWVTSLSNPKVQSSRS